jgi:ABC-type Mn2+/Zn2+ transport system permease subunit
MAIAIIWGLVFSTGLTLLVVPCIYLVVDDIRRRIFGQDMFVSLRERERALEGVDRA